MRYDRLKSREDPRAKLNFETPTKTDTKLSSMSVRSEFLS